MGEIRRSVEYGGRSVEAITEALVFFASLKLQGLSFNLGF